MRDDDFFIKSAKIFLDEVRSAFGIILLASLGSMRDAVGFFA